METDLKIYRRLSDIIGLFTSHGRQSFADSPTPDELFLDSDFAAALQDPLTAAYLLPLEGDLSDLIQESRDTIEAELMRLYRDTPSISDSLRLVLLAYAIRAYNLGGSVALEELELDGQFSIDDPGILNDLNDYTDTLVDVDGDMSLLRTTARELSRKIKQEQEAGSTWQMMLMTLIVFARARVAIRSVNIAANERVRISRLGLASTLFGNGITAVIHRLNRDTGRDYPPCRCPELNGRRYVMRSARNPFGAIPARNQIPVHMNCNCYYDPDREGWTAPAVVWTGFALTQL